MQKLRIVSASLPDGALLDRYRTARNYTDCLCVDLPAEIDLTRFVEAFYTSRAFKPERVLLARLLAMPSTDADAAALGAGRRESFAAWTVEARTSDQLLLCDYRQATRSWLMAAPLPGHGGTRLFFGSAVVLGGRPGARRFTFAALLWFHKLYARVLLASAARRALELT